MNNISGRPARGVRAIGALACVLGAFAVAQPASAAELPRSLAKLSPADFASRIKVENDPLEDSVIFSSQSAYKRDRMTRGAFSGDAHLRAVLDRKTGAISWQMWNDLSYSGARKSFGKVHFITKGSLHKVSPSVKENWIDDCPESTVSCHQYLRVAFELPEDTIREIADAYRPGNRTSWKMRFKDDNGHDVTAGLAPAEAAGLISVVERWKQKQATDRPSASQ
jgi:hypothetical protein